MSVSVEIKNQFESYIHNPMFLNIIQNEMRTDYDLTEDEQALLNEIVSSLTDVINNLNLQNNVDNIIENLAAQISAGTFNRETFVNMVLSGNTEGIKSMVGGKKRKHKRRKTKKQRKTNKRRKSSKKQKSQSRKYMGGVGLLRSGVDGTKGEYQRDGRLQLNQPKIDYNPVIAQKRQNDAVSAVNLIEKNMSGLIGYAGVALVLAVIIIKVLL
jgi:hypothetical protein